MIILIWHLWDCKSLNNIVQDYKSGLTELVNTDNQASTVNTTSYTYTYNAAGQPTARYLNGNLLATFSY